MKKILVLYYSMYGHIETMAHTAAEGARGLLKNPENLGIIDGIAE